MTSGKGEKAGNKKPRGKRSADPPPIKVSLSLLLILSPAGGEEILYYFTAAAMMMMVTRTNSLKESEREAPNFNIIAR